MLKFIKFLKRFSIILIFVLAALLIFNALISMAKQIIYLERVNIEMIKRERKVAALLYDYEQIIEQNPNFIIELEVILRELNRALFNQEVVIIKESKFLNKEPI